VTSRRPRNTWRRDLIAEMERVMDGKIWNVCHKTEQGGGLSSVAYTPPRSKQSDISDKKNNNVSFEDLDIHYIYIKYLDTLLTL
jgi:hypothetical protein